MRSAFWLSVLGLLAGCASAPVPTYALYRLPYQAGASFLVVQPGPGWVSHKGSQRYAIDWAMPEGTPVLAARDGVVTGVKEDSNVGGTAESMAKHGNFVRVQHGDGTAATYLHLKQNGALVDVGQRVTTGQHIAYSGNTGWTSMPHLHFQVDRFDPSTGRWSSIPVAFQEVDGDGIPGFLAKPTSRNAR